MKFTENPYYNPEKCGLEIFDTIDTGESYEYDMLVIWKKLDNSVLYWDTDSGCSCPSPFDNSDHGHDLKEITKDTFFNFNEALKNHYRISPEEYQETLKKVKDYTGFKL